jgi:energy-coupling factor transport system permease protein
VSFIQILFRREGAILVRWNDFPLIYTDGAREATLVWIRFMILFVLAKVFAQVSLFHFLIFMNKLGLSLRLSLLFQTTLKLIPFIFNEARKALWFLRFRGIDLRSLSIRHKFSAIRKLLYPLLIRGIHYASYSALALEVRGFGVTKKVKIDEKYPLTFIDYFIISITLLLNIWGLNYTF